MATKTQSEGCIYCMFGNHKRCDETTAGFCKCWRGWHEPGRWARLDAENKEQITNAISQSV